MVISYSIRSVRYWQQMGARFGAHRCEQGHVMAALGQFGSQKVHLTKNIQYAKI